MTGHPKGTVAVADLKAHYSRFNRENYVGRDSRNINNRTIDPLFGDTRDEFGLGNGALSPNGGTFSPVVGP